MRRTYFEITSRRVDDRQVILFIAYMKQRSISFSSSDCTLSASFPVLSNQNPHPPSPKHTHTLPPPFSLKPTNHNPAKTHPQYYSP